MKKESKNEIELYHIILLILGLIWMLAFIILFYLTTILYYCPSEEKIILESPLKQLPTYDPVGLSLLIFLICVPVDYLIRNILLLCSNLICTSIGLWMSHYVLITLKIIIFAPIVLLFSTVLYVSFHSNIVDMAN